MLNFTMGPVTCAEDVIRIAGKQAPYFRTNEFSSMMKENERLVLEFSYAPEGSQAVFMTNSSTGSMEAVVMNCLDSNDSVLIIDGGSFGHRFVELCEIHGIPHEILTLDYGQKLTKDHLYAFDGQSFSALLVNIHETSTGVLYDSEMIGEFCNRNHLLYICDCVSSFLVDSFDMTRCHADVMIIGSQKALACHPGVSIIVLSPKAIERIMNIDAKCMYLNLRKSLLDMERGQTPFTPAVNIMQQLNCRLRMIENTQGVENEIKKAAFLAGDFRARINGLPFRLFSQSPSNGITALYSLNKNAYNIFLTLKDEYRIWVCPNGGDLKNLLFRVGHMGALTIEDNAKLINALEDMNRRELL